MNKSLAYIWLVLIGSNAAQYFSDRGPYLALVTLAGGIYFSFAYQKQLLQLLVSADIISFVLVGFVTPVVLMLLSERSFERGDYTSIIALLSIFCISTLISLRKDNEAMLAVAAFTIVSIGAAINLYELLLSNNTFSTAPGRSAGFYVNPNLSAQALLGFALLYLLVRVGELRIPDYLLLTIAFLGIFSTVSRGGILAAGVLLTGAVLIRIKRKNRIKALTGALVSAILVSVALIYGLENIDFSQDAAERIDSLINRGGVGDYEEVRGAAARVAMELAMPSFWGGVGVRTIYEMVEGPHNMFLAMMVDYGVAGLVLYVLLILRLIYISIIGYSQKSERALIAGFFSVWLLIFSLFSHNILDDTGTMPLFALALVRAFEISRLKKAKLLMSSVEARTL